MRIFNKNRFVVWIFECVLSLIALLNSLVIFDTKLLILGIIVAFIGIASVARSLSQEDSERDRIEKLDERNVLILVKIKSTLMSILRSIIIGLIFLLLIVYSYTKNESLIIALLPLFLLIIIMFFAEIILTFYYEKKL